MAMAAAAAAVVTAVLVVLAEQEVCLRRQEGATAASPVLVVTVVRRTVLAMHRIVEVGSRAMDLDGGTGRDQFSLRIELSCKVIEHRANKF